MDVTRQSKINRLMQKELANYFLLHSNDFKGAMVSVTEVRVTPDLDEARIFVSIFPPEKRKEVFDEIDIQNKDIRFEVAQKTRHQLRRIPSFIFMKDESLDYAERIEALLAKNRKSENTDGQPSDETKSE